MFQDPTVYGRQDFRGFVPDTKMGARCYSSALNSAGFERAARSVPQGWTPFSFIAFIDKTEDDDGRTYYPVILVSNHLPAELRRKRMRRQLSILDRV